MIQTLRKLEPEHRVRDATIDDVDVIHSMMEFYAANCVVMPRSKDEIRDSLMTFSVIEYDNETVGCAALEIYSSELCEVKSLVIADHRSRSGFGRTLVEELIGKSRTLGLKRIMGLTYVPEFFHRLGFRTVPKEIFPEKVWRRCHKFNDREEIAVTKDLA